MKLELFYALLNPQYVYRLIKTWPLYYNKSYACLEGCQSHAEGRL